MTRPPILARAGALLAGALLAGCAVGPDYQAPAAALPPGYAAPGAAPGAFEPGTPGPAWWRALGDPDLDALVERATQGGNLDLAGAEARVEQARAQRAAVAAAELPQVDARAALARDHYSRNSELFANLPFPNPQVQFTDERLGLDASWEIDLFGHTRRGVEAAQARWEAARADWRDLRLRIAGEVASTYLQMRQAERRLALARDDGAALHERLDLVERRRAAGAASELEVHRARADAAAADAAAAPWIAESSAARNALAVLVGAPPEGFETQLAPRRPIPQPGAGQVAVGLPSTLVRRRPDLRRADRELAAATAEIGVATADLYPRFDLVGNLGADTVRPGELTAQASRTWSIAPQLYLPLFGRGRLTATVAQREAARDQALAVYREAVLAALADVETAMLRFDRARARRDGLERAAAELEASAALAREQQAAGRAGRLDVLQAERDARMAQEQLADARTALAQQWVALCKALGGGWSDEAGAPQAG
jgi:NodT family efflux transporter outer membrane factor (OMF) lipoprotein